jgi:uncharacterized membrane protein
MLSVHGADGLEGARYAVVVLAVAMLVVGTVGVFAVQSGQPTVNIGFFAVYLERYFSRCGRC